MAKKSTPPSMRLDDKQLVFVEEYCTHWRAKQAAINAGYPEKGASEQATRLLKMPRIKAAITRRRNEMISKLQLSREEVLRQLFYCVTRDARDFCDENGKIITDVTQLNDRACASIDAIEQTTFTDPEGNEITKTKLKLVSKAAALDMAMKHKGLFAAQDHNVKISLDLAALYGQGQPMEDEVEARIKNPKLPPSIKRLPDAGGPIDSALPSGNSLYTTAELVEETDGGDDDG